MNGVSIEALGFTREEIEQKVIERIVREVMDSVYTDDEDQEYHRPSQFSQRLEQAVRESIDKAVGAIAEKHILPNVEQYVENVTFQETNRWGEPKKEPIGFKEYLAQRAENYLTEKVDFQGKAKGEDSFGSWKGEQTRVTFLVHRHLHHTIESVMKDAVKGANERIVGGIEETVKLKLKEISESLKVNVSTK